MVKTYLIGDCDGLNFQNSINDFIKDKKVIDIKYQAVVIEQSNGRWVNDRALIIYEEEEKGEKHE